MGTIVVDRIIDVISILLVTGLALLIDVVKIVAAVVLNHLFFEQLTLTHYPTV